MHWLQMVWAYNNIYIYTTTEFNEVCHGVGTVPPQYDSMLHSDGSFIIVCYMMCCSMWAYQLLWWPQLDISST